MAVTNDSAMASISQPTGLPARGWPPWRRPRAKPSTAGEALLGPDLAGYQQPGRPQGKQGEEPEQPPGQHSPTRTHANGPSFGRSPAPSTRRVPETLRRRGSVGTPKQRYGSNRRRVRRTVGGVPELEVALLGPPRVLRDGVPVAFDTRKAMALLAYLALSEGPRPRDALADLLWPDADLTRARGALRRTLSALRTVVGADRVEANRDHVRLVGGPGLVVDVDRFRELRAAGDLEAAVALFRGPVPRRVRRAGRTRLRGVGRVGGGGAAARADSRAPRPGRGAGGGR